MFNNNPNVYNTGLTESQKQVPTPNKGNSAAINQGIGSAYKNAPVDVHIDARKLPIRGGNDNIPVTYDPKTGMLFTRDHDVTRSELEAFLKRIDSRFDDAQIVFNKRFDAFSEEIRENLRNVVTYEEVQVDTLPNPGRLGVIYITYEMTSTGKQYRGTYLVDPSKGMGFYVQLCEVHNIAIIKGGDAYNA